MIAPAVRSPLPFFVERQSYPPTQSPHGPLPYQFSLLCERPSEETIFVQEICDAEARRWSLRVPASGLPEDTVYMLEELEKLAVELGQALRKIARMERDAAAVNSSDDESSVEYDAGTGLSLAKEKNRIFDPERGTEDSGARPSELSSVAVSSPSEKSLTCIHLTE
ncbi:hypothetical protein F5888DRAFT_1716985, partial [Russula emetica]